MDNSLDTLGPSSKPLESAFPSSVGPEKQRGDGGVADVADVADVVEKEAEDAFRKAIGEWNPKTLKGLLKAGMLQEESRSIPIHSATPIWVT